MLRPLADGDDGDVAFILRLLNEPSFLQYIGDRGVRTLDDARAYIRNGPMAMYARYGLGLLCVETTNPPMRVGICGLLQRDTLPAPDIGFAFLPEHWGKGYAIEAARAVMAWAQRVHGLTRILAINSPGNEASIRVLGKLGMVLEEARALVEGGEVVEVRAWGEG